MRLTREFNGQTTTTMALLGQGNLLKNNSRERSGRHWNMIDFQWQSTSVRWRRRPLDSEFQTKPHFVDQTVALCQRNGFEELMTK